MADESQTSETNPTPPTAGTFDAFVDPHLRGVASGRRIAVPELS